MASSNRRPASEGEIRNRNLGSSRHDLASKATGEAFGRQSGDHPVRLGGQLTRQGLQIVLGGQQLSARQGVDAGGGGLGVAGAHHRDPGEHLISIHDSNISSRH